MHDAVYMRGRNYKLNILQLVGTFVLFVGILGIFSGIANMYQDWTALSNIDNCYAKAESAYDVLDCRDAIYKETGIVLSDRQPAPSSSQNVSVLFNPLIWLLLWIAIALFGIFLHNVGGKFAVPQPKPMPEKKFPLVKKTK